MNNGKPHSGAFRRSPVENSTTSSAAQKAYLPQTTPVNCRNTPVDSPVNGPTALPSLPSEGNHVVAKISSDADVSFVELHPENPSIPETPKNPKNPEKRRGGRTPLMTEADLVRLLEQASHRSPCTINEAKKDAHLWTEALLLDLAREHFGIKVSLKTLQRRIDAKCLRPLKPHKTFLASLIESAAHKEIMAKMDRAEQLKSRTFFVFRYKLLVRDGKLFPLNDAVRSDEIAPDTERNVFYAYCLVSPGGRQRYYHFTRKRTEEERAKGLINGVLKMFPESAHVHLLPIVTTGIFAESATLDSEELKDSWAITCGKNRNLHVVPVRVPYGHPKVEASELRFAISAGSF